MKKIFLIIALILMLTGCKKSAIEIEIEQLQQQTTIYELRKAKLAYLKDLMDIRENLSLKERMRLVDSLITEERIKQTE